MIKALKKLPGSISPRKLDFVRRRASSFHLEIYVRPHMTRKEKHVCLTHKNINLSL